jgi:S1-C subfamily serine protease
MKKIIGLLTAGLLLFYSPTPPAAADHHHPPLTKLYKKLKPTVVSVNNMNNETVGTGVLVDTQGTIVTSAHLFTAPMSPYVNVSDYKGNKYLYQISKIGNRESVALLKPASKLFPKHYANFRFSRPEEGESVFIIGHPAGLRYTIHRGIVSYYGRPPIAKRGLYPLMQVDMGIIGGFSGGAIFDANGYIIGVAYASLVTKYGASSVAYTNTVTEIDKVLYNGMLLLSVNTLLKKYSHTPISQPLVAN